MINQKLQISKLSLYTVAVLCFTLALIMLLVPFTVTQEETVWAAPPGKTRQEIESISKDYEKHFFEYIEYLKLQDVHHIIENIVVISIILSLLLTISTLCVEIIFAITKKAPDKKIIFLTSALAIVPLVSIIFTIIVQSDTAWRLIEINDIRLAGYNDWNIYEEITVRGHVNLVPTIIFSLIGFLSYILSSILPIVKAKMNFCNMEKTQSLTEKASPSEEI